MSSKQKKQSAFTLIELLVVIAIIGLLASIIVVALKQPREKAGVAAGLKFSQTVHNALGSEIVGWWSFETITGNQTPDNSGQNNPGIINGAVAVPGLAVSGGGTGQALRFDGNDTVTINDPVLGASQMTVCAWANKEAYVQYQGIVTDYVNAAGARNFILGYENPANTIRFFVGNGSAVDSITIAGFTQNKWHFVCGSFNGNNDTLAIYLDGRQARKTTTINNIGATQSTSHFIGSYVTYEFNGIIDEVRIYKQGLTASEIRKHYAEGLKRHQILAAQAQTIK